MNWSASSNSNNRNNAWNFNGDNGNMDNNNRNNTNSVRCVAPSRDNPCPFSFEEVFRAYKLCRKSKRPSPDQIRFELKLGESLSRLVDELNSGSYAVSPYRCFIVTHPKPREIFAANFRDRVVHHVIVSRLTPLWERKFYDGSFACRKGKGTHSASRYLIQKHREVSHGGMREVFFLQLDLASFFVTINRQILYNLLSATIADDAFRELVAKVVLHDPTKDVIVKSNAQEKLLIPPYKSLFHRSYPDQGIPIGNLTSQFGANVYLNSVDHFVSRRIRPAAYLRYMDDLLLLSSSREELESAVAPIGDWIRRSRHQELNPHKTILGSFRSVSMNYLGYKVCEKQGELILLAQEDKKWNLISEARTIENEISFGKLLIHPLWPPKYEESIDVHSLCRIRSRLGYFSHSRSHKFKTGVVGKLEAAIDLKAEFFGARKCKI